MKITMTCPAFSPNGGIRVILDVAHELSKRHDVTILCPDKGCHWYPITVRVIQHNNELKEQDVLIICSPHHIHLKDLKIKAKKFAYIQMIEHLFQPQNLRFKAQAMRFYRELPFITISQWGLEEVLRYGNRNKFLYIGNGVNFEHFPISNKRKKTTILLESPVPTNPTKDRNQIALKVGNKLRELGHKVVGYGALKADLDEFYVNPDLKTLNRLYSDAMILIKATQLDFRSTSPLEAGTKGCVTVRAITKGDDDLVDDFNCVRVPYNETQLLAACLDILSDEEGRKKLAKNMINHLKENTWEKYVNQIEEFICA